MYLGGKGISWRQQGCQQEYLLGSRGGALARSGLRLGERDRERGRSNYTYHPRQFIVFY